MSERRITELDSLRGIVAFTVLIHHCMLAITAVYSFYNDGDPRAAPTVLKVFMFSPLHVFWNGQAAVLLFFVLSGFVLSIPYYNNSNKPGYTVYIIKRVCRIWLPYVVIVTIAALLLNYYNENHGIGNLSVWFNDMWRNKISLSQYAKSVFMAISSVDTQNIDTTLWTVIIEMKVSLLLPFILVFIKNNNFIKTVGMVVFFFFFWPIVKRLPIPDLIPHLSFLYYINFFIFGAILYKYRLKIKAFDRANKPLLVIVAIVLVVGYSWDWLYRWIHFTPPVGYISDNIVALICCCIIMMCLMNISSFNKVLNYRVFTFLGKISYSLYLIHPVVLLTMVYSFRGVPYPILFFLIVGASVVCSYIFYLFVEKPSMRLGHHLSSLVKYKQVPN